MKKTNLIVSVLSLLFTSQLLHAQTSKPDDLGSRMAAFYRGYMSGASQSVTGKTEEEILKEMNELIVKIKKETESGPATYLIQRYRYLLTYVKHPPVFDIEFYVKRGNESYLRKLADDVKKTSDTRPPETEVQTYLNFAKANSLKADLDTDYYLQKGYEAQMIYWTREIMNVFPFRAPVAEVEEYNKANNHLKRPFNVNTDWYLAQGKKNSAKREESCTAVDMRYRLGHARDQGSLGLCYAYSAADLISFQIGRTVSPIDINRSYEDVFFEQIAESFGIQEYADAGSQDIAVMMSNGRGVCLESDLPSNDYSTDGVAPGHVIAVINTLKKKYDKDTYTVFMNCSAYGCFPISFQLPTSIEYFWSSNAKDLHGEWRKFFPHLKDDDIKHAFKEAGLANVVKGLIDQNCDGRRLKYNFKVGGKLAFFAGGGAGLLRDIDYQLDRRNLVSISYNSSILKDRYNPNKGLHASSIIGRSFNKSTGSCEYIVRNSWGEGCNYDSKYKCEKGNIWVPEEYISRALVGINYIE